MSGVCCVLLSGADHGPSVRDGIECEKHTGAEVAFVSEAGHLPFAEQPEDFLLVVEEFLARLGLW